MHKEQEAQRPPAPGDTAPTGRPLNGVRVIEMGTVGPVPFCGMLLADMGASVVRVDKLGGNTVGVPGDARHDIVGRGKQVLALDLKSPAGRDGLKGLVAQADVLIEGFRPGVMERLGLGPADCHAFNPGLVYGRLTGWGQDGPLAQEAGHDINYLGLTGALSTIGAAGAPPVPPLNLLGDYAGGSLYLAYGIALALLQRQSSGHGQVIDAAMVDGVSSMLAGVRAGLARGSFREARGRNVLDGGAPFYATYRAADGHCIAVGCIEARFFSNFLALLGLAPELVASQYDESRWDALRERIAERVAQKTRAEWVALATGAEACVSAVLSPSEALHDPHMLARAVNIGGHGCHQPAVAPRMSGTRRQPPARPGAEPVALAALSAAWT